MESMRIGLLLALGMLLIICQACRSEKTTEPAPPQQGSLSDLFELEEELRLVGTEDVPLFSVVGPLVTEDKVYIANYRGHQVLVYDRTGELIRVLGQKGAGPGEFQMPYGVGMDKAGNLYVNDRGNARVQVFSSTYEYVRTVSTQGQNEQLFVINDGPSISLFLQGVAGCGIGRCLFQEYDFEGNRINEFAMIDQNFLMNTWQAARDAGGNFYLVNVQGEEVEVFSAEGDRKRAFKLDSPTMQRLEGLEPPQTPSEMAAGLKRLNQDKYTQIRSISTGGMYVFVQFQRKNQSADVSKFVLDVYDKEGRLRYYGIETPGILQRLTDKFYVVSEEDSVYGALTIRGYSLKG